MTAAGGWARGLALAWLAVVLTAALHVASAVRHGLPVQSDLMALLPREDADDALGRAKDRMAEALAGRVVLMVGHDRRDTARTAALDLRRHLEQAAVVRPGGDVPQAGAVARLGAAYFPHRAGLLAEADRQRLLEGRADDVVRRALAQIYGVGGPADSRLLVRDPFLLFPAFLAGLPAPGNRLTLEDGLLVAADGPTVWVMLPLALAGEPYDLDFQRRFLDAFAAGRALLPADIRLLRLGALFFAQAGADQALAESTRIGLLSVVGIVALVLLVFRTVGPLVLSVLAIAVGLVVALSVALTLFGTLHVAAQLFGAGLIGVAVDYALLYFGQIFTPRAHPLQRLAQVRPALLLAAAAAMIGYGALGLSPFPGFRQVAVFSVAGLAGSLLTVLLWFPLLDASRPRRLDPRLERLAGALWRWWQDDRRRWERRLVGLGVLGLAAWGAAGLRVDDDIRRQQQLSPALMAEQQEIQRLAGFAQDTRFFVVEGESEQQVLEREEALGERLAGHAGWQAMARFVPSARRQADNAALAERTLNAPHLNGLRARLGMPPPADAAPAAAPLVPADILALGALPFLQALEIAPTLHVVTLESVADASLLPQAAQGLEGVRLVDPTADVSRLLTAYRGRALVQLGLTALLILPLLAWRHGWPGAARVLAPALAAVAATPALLALAGLPFSFFAAMALVLLLSLATDYAVFCAEDRDGDPVTLVSVWLAMASTLLSFGLLALSAVPAVRAFGATMLVGVALAFALAPWAAKRR